MFVDGAGGEMMSNPASVVGQGQAIAPGDGAPQPAEADAGAFVPSRGVRDALWLVVVCAFVVVLLASVAVEGVFVFVFPNAQPPQVLLTLFTAAASFLGGLFAPSPFGANHTHDAPPDAGADTPG
jgi:hypothetical protein